MVLILIAVGLPVFRVFLLVRRNDWWKGCIRHWKMLHDAVIQSKRSDWFSPNRYRRIPRKVQKVSDYEGRLSSSGILQRPLPGRSWCKDGYAASLCYYGSGWWGGWPGCRWKTRTAIGWCPNGFLVIAWCCRILPSVADNRWLDGQCHYRCLVFSSVLWCRRGLGRQGSQTDIFPVQFGK